MYQTKWKDPMASFIEETLEGGKPALLLGPSIIGKTTKIETYCKEHGCSLKYLESYQIGPEMVGMPVKREAENIPWEDCIDKDLSNKDSCSLSEAFKIHAPMSYFVEEMKSFSKDDKQLVLCLKFDMRRKLPSPIQQAAVCEILLRNKVARVPFSDGKLKFIVEGTIPTGCEDIKPFPDRMMERFSSYFKADYNIEDAEIAMEYMRENEYFKPLLDFIEAQGNEYLLRMLQTTSHPSLNENNSDLRSIHELSTFLISFTKSGEFSDATHCQNVCSGYVNSEFAEDFADFYCEK